MIKRLIDITFSSFGLVFASPVILLAMLLIFGHDGHWPLYRPVRVGRGGHDFRMAKLRTMTVDAEHKGGSSTSRSDARITLPGRLLRRWKIDELPQLWNVLLGQMSLVGPRPNVRRGGVDRYTPAELRLLEARPGVTDLASIVFADEADILDGAPDPDALYDRVIRPWKSRLGLLYLAHRGLWIDLRILALTALALFARRAALEGVDGILAEWGAGDALRSVCRREGPLPWAAPPGLPA
jgi:lipopolysaccharide/colanic/teichoic acid biosynthesis glycosyltransferase